MLGYFRRMRSLGFLHIFPLRLPLSASRVFGRCWRPSRCRPRRSYTGIQSRPSAQASDQFLAIHCLQNPQCVLSSFAQACRVVKATGGVRRACLFSGLRRIGRSCEGPGVEVEAGGGQSILPCVGFTLPVLLVVRLGCCR